MKLYEFTFTDNQNLPESGILESLQDFIVTEAEQQGWASGYNLRMCKEVVQLDNGQKQYLFEVFGEYIDSNSVDFNKDLEQEKLRKTISAAKELEI